MVLQHDLCAGRASLAFPLYFCSQSHRGLSRYTDIQIEDGPRCIIRFERLQDRSALDAVTPALQHEPEAGMRKLNGKIVRD